MFKSITSRWGRLIAAVTCVFPAGCSDAQDPVPSEPIAETAQALVDPARVMGFESVGDWSITSGSLSSSTLHTQGSASLGVSNIAYAEVDSVNISTPSGVTNVISYDLMLPDEQPNPFWKGFTQLLVSIPSQGVNNAFVGHQELQNFPLGIWKTVSFSLAPSLMTKLRATYSDLRFKVVLNVPAGTGTYRLDAMRFRNTERIEARARATTVTLGWEPPLEDVVGYNVYRAAGGGAFGFVNRALEPRFEDYGLALASTYRYQVRPVTPQGQELGARQIQATTRSNRNGISSIPRLDVLVAIYRRGSQPFPPEQIERYKAGLAHSQLFYLRNSLGKLHLDMTILPIDAPGPSTAGVTMDNIDRDLSSRGVVFRQFDGVYAIAENIVDCWGGFHLPSLDAAGAYGNVCPADYPLVDPNVDHTIIWNFVHEFQHAVDFQIAGRSPLDMIHGHPHDVYFPGYSGPVIDAGENFDWQRALFRAYPDYATFSSPFDGYIEVDDSDQDGLANADARLAMDEARFGSPANAADTDADGLSDLGEFFAGAFAGSDPRRADTDGDGLRDAVDPDPRAPFPTTMRRATPAIDGFLDASYTRLRNGVDFSYAPGFTVTAYASWQPGALNVYVDMNASAHFVLHVDGSGANGYWHGDDSYAITLQPGQPKPLLHSNAQEFYRQPGDAITAGSLVTRTVGTRTIVEARIPSNLGQGFGLTGNATTGFPTADQAVLGLRLWFTRIAGSGFPDDVFSGDRAFLTQIDGFEDVRLVN